MKLSVKICGLSTSEAVDAAVTGGARYVGLVFYARSPRAVDPALAAQLARRVPTGVRTVGLFVEPEDEFLESVVGRVPLDLLQLHGDEEPARVVEIRERYGLPVMKAIRVATRADLARVPEYEETADRLLFDAKPPPNVAALPGGNGLPFDWSVLAGRSWTRPWMLSGGLNRDNLGEAVAATGAEAVDVSSGVEDRPGHKHPDLIRAFLDAAAALQGAG
ncbi:MAG TPA: phosphoribosylanthranilate isomerase [Alphaproteobacteria bacterium]|nr:phosphoribosylanthranilate isomerase [Alphaproteobacteria bacterium]